MAFGVETRAAFTAHDRERSAHGALQKSLGGIALAGIALACGWMLYSNLVATNPVDVVTAPAIAVIAARPAATTESTVPAEALFDIALLNSAYSLGLPPVVFSHSAPPKLKSVFRAVILDIPQADIPVTHGALPERAPVIVQAVQSVPLPKPRPSELGLAQIRTPAAVDPFEKLFGKRQQAGPALAYASADGGVFGNGQSITSGKLPSNDGLTAIYDITARMVYLPDGAKLEAHSGLGPRMDDPGYVHVKMHGATPPHVYDLAPREALFHGDEALRMHPVGGAEAIFGRTGLLTHSYLLGPNGQSNGCVSFKDYAAFLRAYKDGKVKRMVVVASVDDPQVDVRAVERRAPRYAKSYTPPSFGTGPTRSEDDRYFSAFASSLASRTSSSARSLN